MSRASRQTALGVTSAGRGADAIARRLAESGCRFAFGIPGGEVLALIDALERAGIRFVVTRHENGAAFAAEGAWHATGAPGVLVATVGPGAANAANGVANAWQDRVPLIAITGAFDDVETLSYTHQVFDHRALYAPITKATLRVPAGAADVAIERAIAIAEDDPQGPVHVDLPIGVAIGAEPERAPVRRVPRSRGAPRPDALEAARAALRDAARPVIVAGLEVLSHDACDALDALRRALGAPVVTTYKAKGAIDERDALALGGAGLSPRADALLAPVLSRADVVLLAGYDPIEMRRGWRDPFAPGAIVIELAGTPPRHGMHRAGIALIGDVRLTLERLAGELPSRARWAEGEPARARSALREAFAPEPGGWGPFAIAHAVRRALPDDAILTVDTGAHRIALAQAFESRVPRAFLQSSGLGTMGCAVPLAIGHAIADPRRRPVVAIVGDGGLDMSLGELATARDVGAPIAVVVIDDQALELIALKQRADRYPPAGVALGATDYAAVARALGGRGMRATSTAELERALASALGAREERRFTVIHCPIAPGSYDGRI